LGLFLLLSLLPLIILGLVSYRNARRTLEENIGHKLEELARLAMERVDHQMAGYFQEIQTWANLEVMQDVLTGDADGRITAALENFRRSNPFYLQLSCLNQDGKVIASSGLQLVDGAGAETEWFKQAMTGQIHMSKLGRLENDLGITFSVPIWAIGTRKRVVGVLLAVLDWESIYPILESIRIEKTVEKQLKSAHIMIINQEGVVIFAPEWERRRLDNILKRVTFPDGVPGVDTGYRYQTGYTIQLDEHNRLSLIGYAHSGSHGDYPGTGWITLALQNLEQAFTPVFRLRRFIVISFIALALAAILVAHLFARQLTVPLKSLTQAARRIAQKAAEPNARFAESIQVKASDEIGILAESFNQMAQALQDRNQRLDANYKELEYVVNEIQRLLESAIASKSFKVRFHNPELVSCWEVKQCGNTKCPAYKAENQRCWHIAGTFCKGKVQGTFAQKLGDCCKCEIYQRAVSTRLYAIGEIFNNMMEMLEEKNQQVKDYAQNLEEKVKERTAELEQANRELKETQEQLVQAGKLAAIGQLAAGVSHELNNPLGGILGYSQFILEIGRKTGLENISPERLKKIFTYVGYIERESQRCKTIVANLLKFSRASETDVVPLDINQVLEETLVFTRHQLEMNQVELIQDFTPNLPKVMGNEHQLQQVFTNLMVNAQQAMKDGGKLTISTTMNNGLVEIAFADTGCGIPSEHLGKLFDPFFTTKEVGEGTGLGLSVSYGIIQAHKGRIEVESEPGKGSIFRVKLPVAETNQT
jgi:signal transduction histidine kinase